MPSAIFGTLTYLIQILKKIQNSFYKIERTNGVLGISILHGGKQKNGWCPKRCGRDCIYMLNFLEEG